ncbi:MAG: glycosyltransferase family 4 protein [Desulfobulbus sp.]
MTTAYLEKRSINKQKLRIGLTEKHGMVKEYSLYPPEGIEYTFLESTKGSSPILRSPIKGYFRSYESKEHDLIEATLSPVFTPNNWIYSVANFQEAMAFNLCGFPIPRSVRTAYMQHLFLKNNFKKLIFWSEAGRKTLENYGKVVDSRILEKTAVVHPAIRKVPENWINYNTDRINILFSGDFFRKGGINVIDVFEEIQVEYKHVNLILCCDENLDFNIQNVDIKNEYLRKIKKNRKIDFRGRIPRKEMLHNVLPQTDIFLLPTYAEAFGYTILEAMAYGIPVISTKISAIPEMIEHEKSGYLIDLSNYECEMMFKGYVVESIPNDFKRYINEKLKKYLLLLIDSISLRKKLGSTGLALAQSKFSFEVRNAAMNSIYQAAV